MVQVIKDMEELESLLKASGHKLVVVEFSAKWCAPCRMMRPIFEELSTQYTNVHFANVDVDQAQKLSIARNIKAVPTFQMFKQNKQLPLMQVEYVPRPRLDAGNHRAMRIFDHCGTPGGVFMTDGFVIDTWGDGYCHAGLIFEMYGADPIRLEEKIRELM